MPYFEVLNNVQVKTKSDQILNNAGGYVFSVDELELLKRFLILGVYDSYYTSKQVLGKQHIENIYNNIMANKEKATQALNLVKELSYEGRVIKNEPSIVVLAIAFAHPDIEVRKKAAEVFPYVIRTGYHLFQFMEYVKRMRGFGRLLKRVISDWYTSKNNQELIYQVLKYKSRVVDKNSSWSHRDVLKVIHPKPKNDIQSDIFNYVITGKVSETLSDTLIGVYEKVKSLSISGDSINSLVNLIKEHNLTWEFIPTHFLAIRDVWESLLPNLPYTATVRNLGRLTALGVFENIKNIEIVYEKLTSEEHIRKARVSPFSILLAYFVYDSGKGIKGNLTWSPNQDIVKALEVAFERTFRTIEPTGKKFLVAVDVSGSMYSDIEDIPGLECVEVGALFSWLLMRTERNIDFIGVDTKIHTININAETPMEQVMSKIRDYGGGGTNLSLPLEYALNKKEHYDVIVVISDSETWEGNHPYQLLERYRNTVNKDVKTILVNLVPNEYSIFPDMKNHLNIVGFDTLMFEIIREFVNY